MYDNRYVRKIRKIFTCELCDYNTSDSKDFNKHLQTIDHKNNACATDKSEKSEKYSYAIIAAILRATLKILINIYKR